MSIGYDVADLLDQIKALHAEIARLTPNNFTEGEARIALSALRDLPDPLRRACAVEIGGAIVKLQAVLDSFERQAAIDFVGSITDEERRLILEHRAKKP